MSECAPLYKPHRIRRTIGRYGCAPGLLCAPVGVAAGRDPHGQTLLYVSEYLGRRVQVMSLSGAPLAIFDAQSRMLGVCVYSVPNSYNGHNNGQNNSHNNGGNDDKGSHERAVVCDFDADCVHVLQAEFKLTPSQSSSADGELTADTSAIKASPRYTPDRSQNSSSLNGEGTIALERLVGDFGRFGVTAGGRQM